MIESANKARRIVVTELPPVRSATRTCWTKSYRQGGGAHSECFLRKFSSADKTNLNNHKPQGTKKMKQILSFKMISAAALLALTIGCASTQTSTQNRESMLVASGLR
jgi:hypothetical protein